MSKVCEKIRMLRLEKRWSQSKAAEQCKINASIWSRIESGTNPTLETQRKIATGFNIPFEDFLSMVSGAYELRIGFAHCIWAAPIIPLVMGGPTPKAFRLTSYGDLQPPTVYSSKPYWYDSLREADFRTGPSLRNTSCGNELPPGYSQWPASATLSTYSAQELSKMLQNREIDCLVAAKHVFDAHESVLLPCARIMDCVGGGAAVLAWIDNSPIGESIKKENIFDDERIKKYLPMIGALEPILKQPGMPKLPLFYQQGTTSERTLRFFQNHISYYECIPIFLRNWQKTVADMEESLRDGGAFIFSAWEPFTSGLESFLKDKKINDSPIRFTHRLHLSVEAPVPYLSFDIMFAREEQSSWTTNPIVEQFLRAVSVNIRLLKDAISSQTASLPIIRDVAGYLDMTSDECLSALSRIDFDLMFYPEWQSMRQTNE